MDNLALTDGGLFDNLGVTPVWEDHYRLLVSNGGAVFEPQRGFSLPGRLWRYIAITGNGGEWMRTKIIRENDRAGDFDGALWGIGDVLPETDELHDYGRDVVEDRIAAMRTDMDAFSTLEQRVLINHGYCVAENALLHQLTDDPDWIGDRARAAAFPYPPPPSERVNAGMRHSSDRKLLRRNRPR